MKLPRKVYAIFPLNENGEIAGVYVGSSANVKERIKHHLQTYGMNQNELHELMRKNGYMYCLLNSILEHKESHFEYDWIDFFDKCTSLRVFNNQRGVCGASWRRLKVAL